MDTSPIQIRTVITWAKLLGKMLFYLWCISRTFTGLCIQWKQCYACAYLRTSPWREWRNGVTGLRIRKHGTGWRWVVSFTPRPLHSRGNGLWYPLSRSWVSINVGLDTVPCRDSNRNSSVVQPAAGRYTHVCESNTHFGTFIVYLSLEVKEPKRKTASSAVA
jgi:hypothetical protein